MNPMFHSHGVIKMRILLSAMSLVVVMSLLLGAAPAAQNVSVGEFAMMLAGRMADGDKAPETPETASETLQKAGVRLRSELASPATEGDAVQAFQQLGITIQSRNGSAPLQREQVQSLIGVFGSTLTARASGTSTVKVSGSKEISATPLPGLEQSIEECQSLPKTQDCQECCRLLFPGGQNDVHSHRICGKACNSKNRNVSATEPTP